MVEVFTVYRLGASNARRGPFTALTNSIRACTASLWAYRIGEALLELLDRHDLAARRSLAATKG